MPRDFRMVEVFSIALNFCNFFGDAVR